MNDDQEMLLAAVAFLKSWENLHLKPYGLRLTVVEGDYIAIMNDKTNHYEEVR